MNQNLTKAAGTILLLFVLAVGAAVVVQLLRSDDPGLLTSAPGLPNAADLLGPDEGEAIHFRIEAGSLAKYVVREKLARLPVSTNAVGETSSVSGDLYITTGGLAMSPPSVFRVDLRTLRSDEGMRDSYIRMTTLRAGQFPFAEFTVTRIDGMVGSYMEGDERELTLSGDMTIRGVTRPLVFTVKAIKVGDALSAVADVDFKMTTFGIQPPDVAVSKAEDNVHLQVVIVARRITDQ